MLKETRKTDPELAAIMDEERDRQVNSIEMIASESIAPIPVMELSGSIFTNKGIEGYPGARYQGGSQIADKMERLACERAKAVFGADHVNIQPLSGTQANYCVYAAVLEPGDKILSMDLSMGGHLSHGSPANWISKMFNITSYGCDKETGLIDYEALERKAHEEKPKMIICGGSSYPRLIDYERVGKIAKDVGAYSLCDMAHIAGLVAAKVIPSPIPYMDFVSSSTTKTFCNGRGGMTFCKEEFAKKLDHGLFPGCQGGMHLNIMAAKCWGFQYVASQEFHDIMEQVLKNAQCLAKELQKHGFNLITGGTDNHMVIVDLRNKGVNGRLMQNALEGIGISVNKQVIPYDPEKPFITSGLRIGTTETTQRGFKEEDIAEVVDIISCVTDAPENSENLAACRQRVLRILEKYPHPTINSPAFED